MKTQGSACKLVFVLGLGVGLAFPAHGDMQKLLQLIDYVAVDYHEAVSDGEIADAEEYHEMQEFVEGIRDEIEALPVREDRSEIENKAARLSALVEERADAAEVTALTAQLRDQLIESYQVAVVPSSPPDFERARVLYDQQCASCHGSEGKGDGPLAKGLNPLPTNFHDVERYRKRTVYGLYNTVTKGVAGTSMRGFPELSDPDRWSLSFYVGQLAPSEAQRTQGAKIFADSGERSYLRDLKSLVVTTPAELEEHYGSDGAALMAYLRTNPAVLFEAQSTR